MYKFSFLLCCFLMVLLCTSRGQYTVNGNATQDNCRCYTLTPGQLTQSGSVWNNNRIDLSQSFNFTFDVNLGCNDANGADGISFVLQPISTSIGSTGSGLGYQGITPAVGVTLDTWQNTVEGDPAFDHIAVQLNGVLNHNAPENIAGPVTMLASGDNVEDCNWHLLRVSWDAPSKTYSIFFDDVLRLTVVKDFVADVFGGNPSVFWGFTGSTGGAQNLQRFCTSLNPRFRSLASQKRCINEPITFFDSTASFGPIVKRYWNFGDGSPVDSVNINPTHTYIAAGDYIVTLRVIGTDGCEEIFTQQVRVGSKPVAAFRDTTGCVNSSLILTDSSYAAVGTIGQWYWQWGTNASSTLQNPSLSFGVPGLKPVRLAVRSIEGCLSDTIDKLVPIYDLPMAAFNAPLSVCSGRPVSLTDQSVAPTGDVLTGWDWGLGNGTTSSVQNPTTAYAIPGNAIVSLQVRTDKGCRSASVQRIIIVSPRPVAFFKPVTFCEGTPTTLMDSSYTPVTNTAVTQWWWSLGNGNTSTQQNPSVLYSAGTPVTLQLVATNATGCVSDTTTRTVVINTKPIALAGYLLPLCTNKAHQFRDSSYSTDGTAIIAWEWFFDNNNTSNLPNPTQFFSPGIHPFKLVVTNAAGCKSDTAFRLLLTSPKPDLSFTTVNGCVNQVIPFTATTSSPIESWIWNYGDGSVGSTQNTQYTYAIAGTYTVTLHAIAPSGCSSDTLRSPVVISATQAFAGTDVVAAAGQPVPLQASGGTIYQWSPPDGLSNPNIANPVAINTADRTYTVRVSTPQGCPSTDQVTIRIYKGPDIYVPTAFSPNNDGRNDLLRAFPVGISKFGSFTVFNRYGETVFYTTNPAFGWNGFFQNKEQPQGAYSWMVSATDYTGKPMFKKGMVVLIR
jgi:gliding motility-associated-like protein